MHPFRPVAAALAVGCVFALTTLVAQANVLIEIDKSTQTMTVSQDGKQLYTWPVSTGIARYDTPSGSYTPFRMEKDHFSREWDDAPMPNSIFFTQRGHAIHGTNHTSIGQPASHGCVRLSVANSKVLFALVKREGMKNTTVELFGEIPPPAAAPEVAHRAPQSEPGRRTVRRLYEDDDDYVLRSAPQRGDGYWRGERPLYWGGRTVYDNRFRPPPPPFFFGRQRYDDWD